LLESIFIFQRLKDKVDLLYMKIDSNSNFFELTGYNFSDFDPHFISECKDFIENLTEIKIEEIKLSDLKCILHLNYGDKLDLQKVVSVIDTPAYKFLKGDKNEFINYKQHNYSDVTNEKRILSTLESIKQHGYPFQNKYIILFNGQDYIRDGLHRAAIMAYLHGADSTIKIMRLYFKGKVHMTYPSDNVLFVRLKWIARRFYRLFK